MHNPGSNRRKYAQPWIPGPEVCTTPDSRPAVCRRLHTFGERLQTKVSSCDSCGPVLDAVPLMDPWASSCERRQIDQRRAGWQLRSIGTWLEFHRVINADRASSCDPHGRGLDAQPWIQSPEVCTISDPRAGSMHNHGSQGQQYAQPWIPGPEVCRRLQTFGERLQTKASSCDPLRAGWNPIE